MSFFSLQLSPNENYLLGAYHTAAANGSNLDNFNALLGDSPKINKRTFFQARKSLAEKALVILQPREASTPATFYLPQQG